MDPASGTERIVVLAETRQIDASSQDAVKQRINDLALNLIGSPVDDIVLAPPHTVPKTSSGKIRRVAARDYYERGPDAVRPQAVWLQFLRLAAAGVAPQLRRGWRVARGMLFALRAYLLFVVTAVPIFAIAATKRVDLTWKVAGTMCRFFLRASGLRFSCAGAKTFRPARWCSRPTTSYLDALVLVAMLGPRPFAFIAKREFLGNPMMKLLLTGFGCVFVERFDVQKSAEHADDRRSREARRVARHLPGGRCCAARAAPVPHRRVPGRRAGRHPGRSGRAARRALGAARRHLARAAIRSPSPSARPLRRRARLERRRAPARPSARRSAQALRRAIPKPTVRVVIAVDARYRVAADFDAVIVNAHRHAAVAPSCIPGVRRSSRRSAADVNRHAQVAASAYRVLGNAVRGRE